MTEPTITDLILQDRRIAYIITDRDLNVLKVGGLADEFYPHYDTCMGHPLVELIPELIGSERALANILEGDLPRLQMDWINRETADGQTVYLAMATLPHHDSTGRITGLLHLVEDYTEMGTIDQQLAQQRNELRLLRDELARQNVDLRAALRDVQENEEKMRALLESAPDGIVLVSDDGGIALVNARTEEMFGYEQGELLGRPIERLIPESLQDIHAEHCAGFFRNPRIRPMGAGPDLTGRRKDGTEFPVELGLSFVETKDGILVMAFVVDVTERKQAEEALQKYSERLEDMVEERTQELREAQAQLLAQQLLQRDLELAEQVQASLLLHQEPTLDGFDLSATALPARYVSGDLYDFVLPDPETCFIVLADISGKGIPAALLASTARTLLRAEIEHEDSPATILSSVNTSFYQDLAHAEMFITFLAARLDARLGALTYASAGHNEILWQRQASHTCHLLPATGLPIGIFADTSISEETHILQPGDALVFFSDGITEAANPQNELFGLDKLIAILSDHVHLSAADLAQTIVEAVETFRADAPRSDDLTLVVLKALPRDISFAHPATLDSLGQVTRLVRQAASAYGDDFAYQIELATSEIVTNVIEHAYHLSSGELRGQITLLPNRIQLDFYDDGTPFDLAAAPTPDLGEPQEGGYGLFITRQIVDELAYTPATSAGNHWRLIKRTGKEIEGGRNA